MGHGLSIGFVGLGIVSALVLVFAYNRINKSRERQMNAGALDQFSAEELSAKGDKALTWRYMY